MLAGFVDSVEALSNIVRMIRGARHSPVENSHPKSWYFGDMEMKDTTCELETWEIKSPLHVEVYVGRVAIECWKLQVNRKKEMAQSIATLRNVLFSFLRICEAYMDVIIHRADMEVKLAAGDGFSCDASEWESNSWSLEGGLTVSVWFNRLWQQDPGRGLLVRKTSHESAGQVGSFGSNKSLPTPPFAPSSYPQTGSFGSGPGTSPGFASLHHSLPPPELHLPNPVTPRDNLPPLVPACHSPLQSADEEKVHVPFAEDGEDSPDGNGDATLGAADVSALLAACESAKLKTAEADAKQVLALMGIW